MLTEKSAPSIDCTLADYLIRIEDLKTAALSTNELTLLAGLIERGICHHRKVNAPVAYKDFDTVGIGHVACREAIGRDS